MKHFVATALCAAMLSIGAGALAADRTVTLAVENMSCASCPYIVKRSLTRVDGVKAVDVSFEEKKAVVRYDDARTDTKELTAATAGYGFPSSVVEGSRHE